MKTVSESRKEFFQYWMTEGIVQDNSQTLGTTSHKPQIIKQPVLILSAVETQKPSSSQIIETSELFSASFLGKITIQL